MADIWSREIDIILSIGRNLTSVGVRNWALERDVALAAIEQLSAMKVAVLGGDVYVVNGTSIESSYDNWYCNRYSDETEDDFLIRSSAAAIKFVDSYRTKNGKALFAIVPRVLS